MDLVWVVYLLDILGSLSRVTEGILIISVVSLVVLLFFTVLACTPSTGCEELREPSKVFLKITFKRVYIPALVLSILIPEKETMYTMLAAYAGSEVYESIQSSEDVQRLAGKSVQVIEDYLDARLEQPEQGESDD